MASLLKAVFSLKWPFQLLLLIQFFLIILVLVVTKKSFKWLKKKLAHVDSLWEQKKALVLINEYSQSFKKQEQYKSVEKYQQAIGQMNMKRFIKLFFKAYSILQSCSINLSINKVQYCILVELWSLLLFHQLPFSTNNNSLELFNWDLLLRYLTYMGWNGFIVILFDFLIQIYVLSKFIQLQQSTNKNKKSNPTRVLFIYYGSSCLLMCLSCVVIMNKIINRTQLGQLAFRTASKSLIKYVIIIFALLFVHQIALLVYSTCVFLLLSILPAKYKAYGNVWFYVISEKNVKSSLNQVKPSQQSLQNFELCLHHQVQNIEPINRLQLRQFSKQCEQDRTTKKKNVYNRYNNRLRKQKYGAEPIIQNTTQQNGKVQKIRMRAHNKKNKYLININTLQQIARQPSNNQMPQQQHKIVCDSLYFQQPTPINSSFPQTPTFQNKLQRHNTNSRKDAKNKKFSISESALNNIQNKIKVKQQKLQQSRKNNTQFKCTQSYDENEAYQIQVVNFDNYFIKDLGVAQNQLTTNSIIKQNTMDRRLFQNKMTRSTKENNSQTKQYKFVRKRYQGSNPNIPVLKQKGFTFCLDEVVHQQ